MADYDQVLALWRDAGSGLQLRPSDEPAGIALKLTRDPDLFLVAEAKSRKDEYGALLDLFAQQLAGFGGEQVLAIVPQDARTDPGFDLFETDGQRLSPDLRSALAAEY